MFVLPNLCWTILCVVLEEPVILLVVVFTIKGFNDFGEIFSLAVQAYFTICFTIWKVLVWNIGCFKWGTLVFTTLCFSTYYQPKFVHFSTRPQQISNKDREKFVTRAVMDTRSLYKQWCRIKGVTRIFFIGNYLPSLTKIIQQNIQLEFP